MIAVKSDFPVSKKELKEMFGYLSFQTIFINMDIVGIRAVKTGEIVYILYRGAWKIGFIYEGNALSPNDVQWIYNDVPSNYNDLDQWEMERDGRVEILLPHGDNYVFINDKEVEPIKNK